MKDTLKQLFTRDLNKLKEEIKNYTNKDVLWQVENTIKNSGGNLCLHIIGNLKTYIGASLANSGYIRKRELEFSAKSIDRESLYLQIDETIEVVTQGLDQISDEQFTNDNFPIVIWKEKTSMAFTLIHLHGHLTYHLGQINYHRRILDK